MYPEGLLQYIFSSLKFSFPRPLCQQGRCLQASGFDSRFSLVCLSKVTALEIASQHQQEQR